MDTIMEKPYVSYSNKKIKAKKDLSTLLMFRDYQKSRHLQRNTMYKKKYYIENDDDEANDDVFVNDVNYDEWIVLPKTVPCDRKPTLFMYFFNYIKSYL